MKKCIKCGEAKPLVGFHKSISHTSGLKNICRKCSAQYGKQYRQGHKERLVIYRAEYRKRNREKMVEYQKAHKKDKREYYFQRNHGLGLKDVLEMFDGQGGRCSICKKQMNMVGRNGDRAHVDHNHITGKNRGLICDNCNRGLGFFHDNIQSLKFAINYLKKDGDGSKDQYRQ